MADYELVRIAGQYGFYPVMLPLFYDPGDSMIHLSAHAKRSAHQRANCDASKDQSLSTNHSARRINASTGARDLVELAVAGAFLFPARDQVRSRVPDPWPHVHFGKYLRFLWRSPNLEA